MKQLEVSTSQNYLLELPELEEASYLIPLWHEAGFVSSTGMGISGLSWTEIHNWLQETGLELTVWEKLMIKHLSDSYAQEYSASSGGPEDRTAPYCTLPENHDRQAVAQKVTGLMQSLMSRQKKPQYTAISEESE